MTEVDWQSGYVHVYTGDGKGKTTAALGLALRAAGAGYHVSIGQFVKGRHYSEFDALRRLRQRITHRQFGRGCFIFREPAMEDILAARKGLALVREVFAEGVSRLVILDEATVAVRCKLFSVNDLAALIDAKPPPVELVLTGRSAPAEIIDRADLVTDMREVKHYYRRGVQGRIGIES